MQAITTKFIAPTNTKGSRIKATCWLTSNTVGWDYAIDAEHNHLEAITSLVDKINIDRKENGSDAQWKVVAVGSSVDGKGYTAIIDLVN